MEGAEFKEGGLYWLARPDGLSLHWIATGHGYLWVGVNLRNQGGDFKSLATGENHYFTHDEMDPVEKEG
jgi:hypothetical protein